MHLGTFLTLYIVFVQCGILLVNSTPFLDKELDTTVVCKTPEIDPSKDRNQTIRVHFDGLTTEISVNYVDDPAFDVFHGILEYDKESTIQIMVNTR
jgi:hypothetical protein